MSIRESESLIYSGGLGAMDLNWQYPFSDVAHPHVSIVS